MRDVATLAAACRALLRHQVGRTDAVAVAACCRAAIGEDLDTFVTVDRRLSATRPAREAREASRRMGRRLLETAATAEDQPWLALLRDHVRAGLTPGNHAGVLGAITGRLGLPPMEAAALALWTATNGFLGAALRLLRVTHDDIQAILVELRPVVGGLAAEAARADPLALAGGAPQLEIWAMRHETATVRLFAS